MAVFRQQPYGNARFLVEIGGINHAGFWIVQLPDLIIDHGEYREGDANLLQSTPVAKRPRFGPLVLKRGFHGDLDLYNWWKAATAGQSGARRDVIVKLLSEDQSAEVAVWKIAGGLPVRYGFSPLDGQDGSMLVEMIEVACQNVEMS
ncbi:MAG TPA: phage tail protein [Opitutaceae bacterium]|nr:phage tail protein [Opitutaceae bacterium]